MLKHIFDTLLIKSKRNQYKSIPNSMKEKYFFIVNRFLSKKYLNFSEKFNYKNIQDKSILMDLWWLYLRDKEEKSSYWVWPTKKTSNKKVNFISEMLKISKSESEFLINNFPSNIEEEIKYFKLLKNKKQL